MASFNKVILMGNLTRDPEVRYTPSGTAVSEVGLAVNRTWFDKGTNQRKEETTFVEVTFWGRQAEVVGEYLTKGRSVLIEGRLHLDQWDDRESGQRRSRLKVIAENMTMMPKADGAGGGGRSGYSQGGQQSHGASSGGGGYSSDSGGGGFDEPSGSDNSGGGVDDFGGGPSDVPF